MLRKCGSMLSHSALLLCDFPLTSLPHLLFSSDHLHLLLPAVSHHLSSACQYTSSAGSFDHGEATATTWPWFDATHEALRERPSIQPPTLVASCLVPSHGQSSAEASPSQGDGPSLTQPAGESDEERVPSTSSQPPTKRPKRGGGMLAFLKEQAKKKEARDTALYEQNERFLSLLEELVKKNK